MAHEITSDRALFTNEAGDHHDLGLPEWGNATLLEPNHDGVVYSMMEGNPLHPYCPPPKMPQHRQRIINGSPGPPHAEPARDA